MAKKVDNIKKDNSDLHLNANIDMAKHVDIHLLPENFRIKSGFIQRLYIFLIVLVLSFSIGFMLNLLIDQGNGSIIKKYNINESDHTLFVFQWLSILLLLFETILFNWWSRTQDKKITILEFLSFIFPGLILIIGSIILNSKESKTFDQYIYDMALITIFMGIIPIVFMNVVNMLKTKTFRHAKFRTLSLSLGLIIASLSGLIQHIFLDEHLVSISIKMILISILPVVAGGVLIAFGIVITYGMSPYKLSGIWSNYRFVGGLPLLSVFSILSAMSYSFIGGSEILSPVLFVIIMDSIMLFIIFAFFFWKARIKNINKTNPMQNEIFAKALIIFPSIIAIATIETLPSWIPNVKEFGTPSFLIIFITSLFVISGLIIIHFFNVITFVKYFKLTLVGVILAILTIVGTTIALTVLKNGTIITKILGNKLTVIFLIAAISLETLSLLINISYVVFNILLLKTRSKIRKNQNQREIEKDKLGRMVEKEVL